MTQFQAETTADLQAVKARLVGAEAELQAVETAAPQAALHVALGKSRDGDVELVARLPVLRSTVDSLRMAVAFAEQAEKDRTEANRKREAAARYRAAAQHLSRVDKEGTKISVLSENLCKAFARMIDAARSSFSLLPPAERGNGGTGASLAPSHLQRLVLSELQRQSLLAGERLITVNSLEFESRDGRVPSLPDLLSRRVTGNLRAAVRAALAAIEPTPAAPAPVVAPTPEVVVEPRSEIPHVAASQRDEEEVVDLRGINLLGRPKSGEPDIFTDETPTDEAA